VALGELWSVVSYAEDGLRIVSWAVLVVGLLAMLIAIYTSLQERRREMAILRSVGAGLKTIAGLLILEAFLLTFVGAALGVLLTYVVLVLTQPLIESSFGMLIPIQPLSMMEWIFLGVILGAGFLVGVAPALKAWRNSLADGLAVRFLIPFFLLLAPQVSEAKSLQIASSVSWLRELASEITCGGKGVELLPELVPPGTDPHSYKLTPRSRMLWSKADLRLVVGEGFESWPEKNAGAASKLFTATRNLNLRSLESHAEGGEAEAEGHAHAHAHAKITNTLDPHIWHSPRLTRETALNLFNFLAPKAPALRGEWETCLRSFTQRTKAVESAVHAKIATIPSSRRVLATNHDSMGYFANTFGLKIVAISGVSTEAQVTPGQLKRAIDLIKKSGAKAVFVESSASPETVQKVAAEVGVKVGGELFADGLSAAGTPAGNITGLWETNAETIATALRP
ncbi:MAG: hypothetical protein RI932_2472, partial [Pseudomonadota bacterium]